MRTLVLSLLAFVALTASGAAEHCTTYSTSSPEIDSGILVCADEWLAGEDCGGPFFIDNDLCQPECALSIWFYQESNGIPGLQREDEVVDDTCHGMIPGDVIWS